MKNKTENIIVSFMCLYLTSLTVNTVFILLITRSVKWKGYIIIFFIIIIYSWEFFTSALVDFFFYWRLSDSKSPQASRTLLNILAVFNNAVVWMISTRPLNYKPSSPFNIPLVTVPNAPNTIGIIIPCSIVCFNSQARSRYFPSFHFFSVFFSPISKNSKVDNFASSLLFVDYYSVWSFGRD